MPFELPFSTVEAMVAFLLVFFRMTGMTLSAPLFSNDSFPMQLRIWVAFFLSPLVFPLVWAQTPEGIFTGVFRHPALAALASRISSIYSCTSLNVRLWFGRHSQINNQQSSFVNRHSSIVFRHSP